MKLLKRIRIINWHYFYNVTIDVETINFLTGENASGKSTLIDALQVVLLGDTSGRMFNKAANEKAGRTLKGYLRGEVGDDGEGAFKYLRNGRFSSYICLEFFDDILNTSFTIGIVFDSFDDGSEEHKFFILEDKIPECNFIQLNVPMSYKQLSEYFQANYSFNQYTFADSNTHYQKLLKDRLGGLKDKYFSLFKKAVSFIPITNIEQFITEYVCDVPNEINIESMRENIQQYKRLEIEAESMQRKIDQLEVISKNFKEYKNRKEEQNLASYISKRITYQIYLDNLSNLQHDIISCENRIVEIEKEMVEIDDKISVLEKEKEQLIGQKVSSGAYQLTSDLMNAKQRAKEKIDALENSLNQVKNNLSYYINEFSNSALKILTNIKAQNFLLENEEYHDAIQKLNDVCEKVIDVAKNFKESFNDNQESSFDLFSSFKDTILEFKEVTSETNYILKGKLSSLLNATQYLKQQTNESDNGGKMYDYQLLQVRSQLKHALEDHFNEKVEVLIYADLVDIKTPRWIKAIEGFISSQKLNFFVEDKYYETANKILPEIMKRVGYYRTGIVDAYKLSKQNFQIDNNALAEEIITSHQGAKDYTDFLLGKIIKCETFNEARESGRGLTPNCNGYRNFASFVIPERNYQYPVIGRKVSKESVQQKSQEISNNENIMNVLRSLIESLNYVNKLDSINSNEYESAKQVLKESDGLYDLKANYNHYQEELDNAGSLEVSTLDKKIKKIEEDVALLREDKQNLVLEKGSLLSDIKTINDEKIPSQISQSEALMKEIKEQYDQDFINSIASVRFDEEMRSGSSLPSIRQKYDSIFVQNQYKLRSLFSLVNELRKEYVLAYKLSYDPSAETNDDFDRDLTLLRDVKLPEYRHKIDDAYQKATKEFKDDFIFKLKTSIEAVRSQIDELNDALKDAKFGQDTYQFTVLPSPQYREYYDMITDDLLLNYGDDESLYLRKYEDIMANLFKLIGDVSGTKDQNSVLEQNVEKFTDYRTYLLFDLLVSKGDAKPYSLARNIKKASGGETQTPFYISILASFSQLYRVNASTALSNSIRLVIFDEAFSKMDSARIIESIKILKNFGLQVILSAPPEKVSELSKLVDKTLLVSRQNGRSFIDTFAIKK